MINFHIHFHDLSSFLRWLIQYADRVLTHNHMWSVMMRLRHVKHVKRKLPLLQSQRQKREVPWRGQPDQLRPVRVSQYEQSLLVVSLELFEFDVPYISIGIFGYIWNIFGICWNDEATWLWLCAGWLNNRLHSSPCKLESLARHLGVCEIVLCKMLKKAIPNLQNDSSIVIKSGKWM